jgi:hypothetical protein
MMPSWAYTQSLAPTTKCYSWLTNTSHPTSNIPPGLSAAGLLLCKRVNQVQPLLNHLPHRTPLPRKISLGRENPTPSPVRRTLPARRWPTHWVKITASTAGATATGSSTAPTSQPPSAMSLLTWPTSPSARTSLTGSDYSRTS